MIKIYCLVGPREPLFIPISKAGSESYVRLHYTTLHYGTLHYIMVQLELILSASLFQFLGFKPQ